ncbi:hypothetical protein ITP53_26530 [Nonomuraea sp. K274]|uniref:Uncharacterized protein n=1 Tax=Nonomuraea cypriaca TaxID=1187855 RepID=A0A931AFE6_9ACTN|nr:hypothetical protein [Nonomuraea cypriaca]MBF8189224.1 hypothetical protein [Nonomuraea cypriaca]
MTNAWDAVGAAIDAEDFPAVATLMIGYDDAQRREVARELPGYLPIARRLHARLTSNQDTPGDFAGLEN